VVIQQELYSNGTAGDHSNSTFSQLMLQQHPAPPPAPAASDCSHGSTGTHPASTAAAAAAAAAAAGGQPPPPPQQQQQTQHQPHSRKRGRPSCQFGNYHHYYGYRLKPSGFEDPRLKVSSVWLQLTTSSTPEHCTHVVRGALHVCQEPLLCRQQDAIRCRPTSSNCCPPAKALTPALLLLLLPLLLLL
jgi:hypothetical protein